MVADLLGTRFIEDPSIVALIVLILTSILFVVSFAITRSFERLAEANRMKSEFVKIVSHQLRSPITNLSWAIDILMSEQLVKVSEKEMEYFKILKENSSRMIELVKDLLTVLRIEEGSLPSKKEKIAHTHQGRPQRSKQGDHYAHNNGDTEFHVLTSLAMLARAWRRT